MENIIRRPESSRVVTLMLTWSCNLNCTYCFEKFKSAGKEMSFETAKTVLTKEFTDFKESGQKRIKVEFFGGEPLLRFDLIKKITEWIVSIDWGVEYELSITTNGVLLDEEKMAWFVDNKDIIKIIMSVDGTEDIQKANRGERASELPLEFVRRTWPDTHFKSTISRFHLPSLAKSLICLLEQGYNVAPSLAIGEDWQEGDELIYKRELEKLADWHLEHRDVEPMSIFLQPFFSLLEPHCLKPPQKNCGTGVSMATYDVDGTCYPCHLFVPITHGRNNAADDLKQIDFNDDAGLLDEDCLSCGMLRICKTCYGFNYKDRGSVKKRDRRACRMQLAEAQVGCDFQINWLLAEQKERILAPIELFALKSAIKCHELYSDFKLEV